MSHSNDKYSTNLDNYSQHRTRNPDPTHLNPKPFDALFEVSPQLTAPNLAKSSSNPYYTYDQGYEAKPKSKVPDFTKRADSRGGNEGAGSPFTTQENYAYELLFDLAGGSDGRLAGDRAVPFFQKSNLDSQILFKIWHMADSQKEGSLSLIGFKVAMKLVALAQAGRPLQLSNLRDVTPLPELEGVSLAALSRSSSQGNSNYSPFEPQFEVKKPPTPFDTLPQQKPATIPLTDAQKYYRIFNKASFQQEFLDGNTVRDIMLKTKLSVELLKNIWTIVDTQGRGYLEAFEFVIAMYYVENIMDGSLQDIPLRLPYSIRESAINAVAVLSRNSTPVPSHINQHSQHSPYSTYSGPISPSYPVESRGRRPQFESGDHYNHHTGLNIGHYHSNSISSQGSVDPIPTLPNLTSQPSQPQQPVQPQAPALAPAKKPPTPSQPASNDEWGIALPDRVKYYSFFDNTVDDPTNSMSGSVAYSIFIKSNLPQNDLGTIWELSDIQTKGSLSRDEFVVAMHLIYQKLMGQELPASLPPSLVPPSLRVYKSDVETPNLAQQFDSLMTSTINPLSNLPSNRVVANQPEVARPISDLISFDPNAQDPRALPEQGLENQLHSPYETGASTRYHSAVTNLPSLQSPSLQENAYTPTSTNLPNFDQGQFSQHAFQQQNQQIPYPTEEVISLPPHIVQPTEQLNKQVDPVEEVGPKRWDASKAFEIQQYLQAAQPQSLTPVQGQIESTGPQTAVDDPFAAIIGSQQVDSFADAQSNTNVHVNNANLSNQVTANEPISSIQNGQKQKEFTFDDLISQPTMNDSLPQSSQVQSPPQDSASITDPFASFITSTASQPPAASTSTPAIPKPPTSAKPVKGLSLTSQGSLRGSSRTRKPSKENKVLSFDRIVNNHAKVEHGGSVLESDLQQDQSHQNVVKDVDPFLMAIQNGSEPNLTNTLENQVDPFLATTQLESQTVDGNTPISGPNNLLDSSQYTTHDDPFLAAISPKPELSTPTQQADPFLSTIGQQTQASLPVKQEDPFLATINSTPEFSPPVTKVDPLLTSSQPKAVENDPFLANIHQKPEVASLPQQEDPFLTIAGKAPISETAAKEDPFLASIHSKPEASQFTNSEDPFLATIADKHEPNTNADQSDPFLSTTNAVNQSSEIHPFSPISPPANFKAEFETNLNDQLQSSQDEPNLSTEPERSQSTQLPPTVPLSESPQYTVHSFDDLNIGTKSATSTVNNKVPVSLQSLFPGMELDTAVTHDATKSKQVEPEVRFDPNSHLQPIDLISYFQSVDSKLHKIEFTDKLDSNLLTKFNYTYDFTFADLVDDFEPYTLPPSQPQTDLTDLSTSNHLPKSSITSFVSEATTAEPTTDAEDNAWNQPLHNHPNSNSTDQEMNNDPFTQLATQDLSKTPVPEVSTVDVVDAVDTAFGKSSNHTEILEYADGFGDDFQVNFPPLDDPTITPSQPEFNTSMKEPKPTKSTTDNTTATATGHTGEEMGSADFNFTPNQDAVTELLGMGFEQGPIYDALAMFDNDLSLATNFLLDQLHNTKN